MKSEVVVRDNGMDEFLKNVRKNKGMSSVKVGIIGNAAKQTGGGADLILIALANEFGTANGRIPPRPFIRGAFVKHTDKLSELKRKLAAQILFGMIDMDTGLSLLGRVHQAQIQQFIVDLRDPPNAESTIERKGSSNPLIDTGRLRNSVSWELDK